MKKNHLYLLIVFCSIAMTGCAKKPINEIPMYGNTSPTPEVEKAHYEFIRAVVSESGSREAAANKALEYAWYFIGQGDLKTAMKRFNQAWLLDPNNPGVYYGFGTLLKAEKKLDDAIKMFDKAIELKPDLIEAYNDRGNSYADKRDFDRAILDFNKAIEIKPDFSLAYYNRGSTFLKKRQFDQAISDYSKVIEMDAKDGGAYYDRACAYFYKKDYDRSWHDLNRAMELGYGVQPGFVKALKKESGREG